LEQFVGQYGGRLQPAEAAAGEVVEQHRCLSAGKPTKQLRYGTSRTGAARPRRPRRGLAALWCWSDDRVEAAFSGLGGRLS
jgi:hypothetical protein